MKVITREVYGTHFLIPVGEDYETCPIELNQTAYEIYKGLSEGQSIENISTILAEQYGVSRAQIQGDVVACYNNLHSKGIV